MCCYILPKPLYPAEDTLAFLEISLLLQWLMLCPVLPTPTNSHRIITKMVRGDVKTAADVAETA